MPLLVCVEDVGWWRGRDGSAHNRPFRTGMPRNHVPEDYAALADLGKALDMKILAGMVLCEWDRQNLLQNLPSATWMGRNWSVPFTDPDVMERAASIVRQSKSFVELAVHGLGHEFWDQGKMQRAEFHRADGSMRDPDEIHRHLSFYFQILEACDFNQTPWIFIPPALKHSFGRSGHGFQSILQEFGIRAVSLRFSRARLYAPPQTATLAWEDDVLLVERGKSEIPWHRAAAEPDFNFDRPVLALHWANILHPDPGRNRLVIDRWARYLTTGCAEKGMFPAADALSCFTQYCHYALSAITWKDEGYVMDVAWMDQVPVIFSDHPFCLKADGVGQAGLDISGAVLQTGSRAVEQGFLKLKVSPGIRQVRIRPRP